jgi:peptide/nickel transport system permease protein
MKLHTVVIVSLTLLMGAGPFFAAHDPVQTNPEQQLQPPGGTHLFGTDLLGRDVLSRYLYGGRQTLVTALAATVFAVATGAALGLLMGVQTSSLDTLLMPFINALLAMPGLILALVVLAAVGRGTLPLSLAIGLSQMAPTALIVRTAVLTVRTQPYVEAAYALGATHARVVTRHILPNIAPTLAAYASVVFGYALLNGAALTFLGLGYIPGTPDWGVMLAEGRAVLRSAPWIGLAPGVTIAALVWAVNSLADNLSV